MVKANKVAYLMRTDTLEVMGSGKRNTDDVAGVQIDADVNALLLKWCEENDKIRRGVLTRIVRWWLGQSEQFQLLTASKKLPQEPELRAAFAATLERMAAELRGRKTQREIDMEDAVKGEVEQVNPPHPPSGQDVLRDREPSREPNGGRRGKAGR